LLKTTKGTIIVFRYLINCFCPCNHSNLIPIMLEYLRRDLSSQLSITVNMTHFLLAHPFGSRSAIILRHEPHVRNPNGLPVVVKSSPAESVLCESQNVKSAGTNLVIRFLRKFRVSLRLLSERCEENPTNQNGILK